MEPNNFPVEEISPAKLQWLRKQLCHDYTLIVMQSDSHDDEVTAFLASVRNKWVEQEWMLRRSNIDLDAYTNNIRLLLNVVLKMIRNIVDHVDSFMKVLEDAPTRPGSPA